MIRKLLLPALAIAMLGGCVTSGYEYRGGYGDYYYGQPRVEYRDYYGGYGGYGYGGYPGWISGYGYGGYGYGGYPYGYYGGYGGFYDPWYFYPRRPRVIVVRPRPGDDGGDHGSGDDRPPMGRHRNDDRPPPWRDLGGAVRMTPPPGVRQSLPPPRTEVSAPRPAMGERDDNRMQRLPRADDLQPAPGIRQERRDPDRELRRKLQP